MPDATAEEEGWTIGVNPPNHRPDAKRWAFRRHDLELHRRSDFQARPGSDLCAKRADVHAACQV